jgi:hypothetical protein
MVMDTGMVSPIFKFPDCVTSVKRKITPRKKMDKSVLKPGVQMHVCKRCRNLYASTSRSPGVCPACRDWLKETKHTHCHNKACDDPDDPVPFDAVKNTKYGKEYHCPKCNSWINFELLVDYFSIPAKGGSK